MKEMQPILWTERPTGALVGGWVLVQNGIVFLITFSTLGRQVLILGNAYGTFLYQSGTGIIMCRLLLRACASPNFNFIWLVIFGGYPLGMIRKKKEG
jgi:hypothetical protein